MCTCRRYGEISAATYRYPTGSLLAVQLLLIEAQGAQAVQIRVRELGHLAVQHPGPALRSASAKEEMFWGSGWTWRRKHVAG